MATQRQGAGTRWIGRALSQVPPRMISKLDEAVACAGTAVRRRIPLTWVKGQTPEGEPITVLVAAHGRVVSYLLKRVFDGEPEYQSAGHVSWLGLGDKLDRLAGEADLVIARMPQRLGRYRMDDRYLCVPECVEMATPVPPKGELPPRARRGQAKNLRVLRRESFTWTISHDEADFDQFYEKIYLPFAHERFHDLALTRSWHRLRGCFIRGGLLWVRDSNGPVAGSLYTVSGRTIYNCVLGLLPSCDHHTCAVTAAIYVHSFELAQQLGLEHCQMGMTRSNLRDGVMDYKKRWGAELTGGTGGRDLFLRWDGDNAAARRVLAAAPPIVRVGDGLAGVAAMHDPLTGNCVQQRAVQLTVPGLRRMVIASPDAAQVRSVQLNDPRVSELDVRIVPAASSQHLAQWLAAFEHMPPSADDTPLVVESNDTAPTRAATVEEVVR